MTQIWQFITGNDYLRFLLIIFISIVIAILAKLIIKNVLKPLAKKTKTKVDDLIVKSLSSIIFYIVIILGFKFGIQHFKSDVSFYNNLVHTVFIIVVSVLALRIISNFSHHWLKEWASKTKSTADDRLIPLIAKILNTVVIVLAFIFVFDVWNINIGPLLTTAGIAGLALGFAVRDSLANILGGVQLVLDKTFKVGDKVQLETGELGVILDVGLRSTKLRTYDNEVIYIPNGSLANAKVKNFTVPDLSIRVNVNFGVVYGANPQKVQQVVIEAVQKIETVIDDPQPIVQFLKMSDFSLDFVARAWVADYAEAYSTQIKMTEVIYDALNQAKIGIPFPTRTVYTKAID
jgi:small-conductance mechanosensitive channel